MDLEVSAWESTGNIGYSDSNIENEDIAEQEVCQAKGTEIKNNLDPSAWLEPPVKKIWAAIRLLFFLDILSFLLAKYYNISTSSPVIMKV
jgi:hypothetical protein